MQENTQKETIKTMLPYLAHPKDTYTLFFKKKGCESIYDV